MNHVVGSRRLHDGTIAVTVPNTLWATDATEAPTRQEERCAVFATTTPPAKPGSTRRRG